MAVISVEQNEISVRQNDIDEAADDASRPSSSR